MHFRFPFSLFSKGLGYAITKLSFYGSQYVNNADTMVNEINITKNAHFSLPKIIKTADKKTANNGGQLYVLYQVPDLTRSARTR